MSATKTKTYDCSEAGMKNRMSAFATELGKLSEKHGITLHVTGGVWIHDEITEKVEYDNDWTSGDISPINSEFNI